MYIPPRSQTSTHIENERTQSGFPTVAREFNWRKIVYMQDKPLNLLCNSYFWKWVFRKSMFLECVISIPKPSTVCHLLDIWGYFCSIFTVSSQCLQAERVGVIILIWWRRKTVAWKSSVIGEFVVGGPETRFPDFCFRALPISPKYLGKTKLVWSEWQRKGAWSQWGFWGEATKVSWKWLLLMGGQKGRKHHGRPVDQPLNFWNGLELINWLTS